jgi:hypothetical protein
MGGGVEDDRIACGSDVPGRSAQDNVGGWPRAGGLAKRKIAEDVIAAMKHQSLVRRI